MKFLLLMLILCISLSFNQKKEVDFLSVASSMAKVVPGMDCFDLKGGTYSCDILETDSEGRILLEFTTNNVITEQEETVLVILQSIENDFAYYYEDICYIFTPYKEEDIERLKVLNDWNCVLEHEKMSHRTAKYTWDKFIIYSESESDDKGNKNIERDERNRKLRTLFAPIGEAYVNTFLVIDSDSQGNTLGCLKVEVSEETRKYFVILGENESNIGYLEIENGVIDANALLQLKKECDWIFQ